MASLLWASIPPQQQEWWPYKHQQWQPHLLDTTARTRDRLGPGAWAPLLQGLHLDTRLLQQQHTKKLQGTKNNCACAAGANYGQKDTKPPKTQLPLLKSQEQKQGPAHAPCTQHHLRGGQTTSASPPAEPWTPPYPHPKSGTSSTLPTPWSKRAREAVTCSHSALLQQGPR